MAEPHIASASTPSAAGNLKPYAAELPLGSLAVGVDNIHHDVYLSPRFTEQTRTYLLELIRQTANITYTVEKKQRTPKGPETAAWRARVAISRIRRPGMLNPRSFPAAAAAPAACAARSVRSRSWTSRQGSGALIACPDRVARSTPTVRAPAASSSALGYSIRISDRNGSRRCAASSCRRSRTIRP